MKVYICKISDFEDFAGLSLLARKRQALLSRYQRKEDKLRCLCAGLLTRFIFGDKANAVMTNKYGKPYVPNQNLFFNLSHAGDYVIIATDTEEIGVDIEQIRSVPDGIAEKCFTADELVWLREQSSEQAFYTLWTAKESIMKADGRGFSMPPESFSIMPIENGHHRVDNINWNLQWYEFDGHMICISSKTDRKMKLSYLSKEQLTPEVM